MELKKLPVNPSEQNRYERARKRVEEIKSFHKHLSAYIIINILLLLIKADIVSALGDDKIDLNFDRWLDWNIWFSVILWGIGLLIHGIYVYRHKLVFLKKWEERKIRELIEKEDRERNRYE